MLRMKVCLGLVALFIGLAGASAGVAATFIVDLNVTADNTTYENFPGNYATTAQLWINSNGGVRRTSALQFTLPGNFAGKTVINADLEFQVQQSGGDIAEARGLTQSWTEGGMGWTNYDGVNPWPGGGGGLGDTGALVDSVAVAAWAAGTGGPIITFDLKTLGLAQAWADGTLTNNGVLLSAAPGGNVTGFWSSDNIAGGIKPVLRLEYDDVSVVIPPPVTREWAGDVSGDWGVSPNWSPSVAPDDNATSAIFGAAITIPQTVFTDAAVTVKGLTFGDTNAGTVQQSYAIAGQGSVTLDSDTSLSTISVLEGSHQFQAVVNLSNATTVAIGDTDASASLDFNNALNLNGHTLTKTGPGTLNINNAQNNAGGSVVFAAGSVGGSGTIGGDLTNNGGTVAPGNSPGTLTVAGNYLQTAGSLSIEIAGLAQGTDYDLLNVDGTMIINGGMLSVTLLDGFNPSVNDVFDFLDFTAIDGAGFDSLSLPALAEGLVWDTSTLLADGTLSVSSVPEPSSIMILGMVLSLVVLAAHRRPLS